MRGPPAARRGRPVAPCRSLDPAFGLGRRGTGSGRRGTQPPTDGKGRRATEAPPGPEGQRPPGTDPTRRRRAYSGSMTAGVGSPGHPCGGAAGTREDRREGRDGRERAAARPALESGSPPAGPVATEGEVRGAEGPGLGPRRVLSGSPSGGAAGGDFPSGSPASRGRPGDPLQPPLQVSSAGRLCSRPGHPPRVTPADPPSWATPRLSLPDRGAGGRRRRGFALGVTRPSCRSEPPNGRGPGSSPGSRPRAIAPPAGLKATGNRRTRKDRRDGRAPGTDRAGMPGLRTIGQNRPVGRRGENRAGDDVWRTDTAQHTQQRCTHLVVVS